MLFLELFEYMDVNKKRTIMKVVTTPCVDVLQ